MSATQAIHNTHSAALPLPSQTLLDIRSIGKRFGGAEVLRHISLNVAQGEFLTLLGASGSGKTTLLRIIAGFERPDEGEVWMQGKRLDYLPPYRRQVNTVFQHYALFPHLSVFENVAYGLRARKVPKSEIGPRVAQALDLVKMSAFAGRFPRQLSGGQQQRVALARALVNRPQLLLLDEPLSALDAGLRREMRSELKALQREVGISFLFVTHDQEEAMALSDRIALLHAGRLEQIATPREIYFKPSSAYTAQFIGQTNLLRTEVKNGIACCGPLTWRAEGMNGSATFSLRPDSIRLAVNAGEEFLRGARVRFRALIQEQSFGGATDLLEVKCSDGLALLVRLPTPEILEGEQIFEFCPTDAVRVTDDTSAP